TNPFGSPAFGQAGQEQTYPVLGHRRVRAAARGRSEGSGVTKPRRSRGEGGIHWDQKRQRFIASLTIGYSPAGKRIVRRGSGKTEAQARARLKQVIQDHDDGLTLARHTLTVAQAVSDWLAYGLSGRVQGDGG